MPRKSAAVKLAEEQNLPGVEDNKIPEIHQAGAALLDVRSRRIALTKEEDEAEQTVVAAMVKNEREYYNVDGLEISMKKGKTKCKVAHVSSGEE